MNLMQLMDVPDSFQDERLAADHRSLGNLLRALTDRDAPADVVGDINAEIERVNAAAVSARDLAKATRSAYTSIVQLVEKRLKLVPRDYYRTLWTSLGLAVFGIPMGVAMGIALDNMAFLGAGLPIGLAIGVGVGASMDSKAAAEGRQLEIVG